MPPKKWRPHRFTSKLNVFLFDRYRPRQRPADPKMAEGRLITIHAHDDKLKIGAIATALAIINMSVGSKAQPQPVLILEYAAMALGLFALVGGLIMMTQN